MSTDGGAGDSGTRRPLPQGQDTNTDLYQWSGRDGQGRPKQGGQPGQGAADQSQDGSITHEDATSQAAHWHPDMSDPNAQDWINQSKIQRQSPLQLDKNGDYVVQFGDDLSTIAARELKNQGQAVTKDSIKAEQAAIIAHNDKNFPSLDTNADLIKTGWKLHLEDRQPQQQQPTDRNATGYIPDDSSSGQPGNDRQPGNDHHRCLPKRQQAGSGDLTPPGYQNKPSVYVNNFYGNNNNVYEGTNGGNGGNGGNGANGDQQAIPRNHQCYGQRGGQGGRGGQQGNSDLYGWDGGGARQQNSGDGAYNPQNNPNAWRFQQNQGNGGNGTDVYGWDGSGTGGRRQPINPGGTEDLYANDGSGVNNNAGNDPTGNNFTRDSSGRYHLQQPPHRSFSNGWGNDGTSYYPGFNDGGQQRQPTTVIINNFYGNNNNVYEGSPQNRIQRHSNCAQNGSDNYYNNGGGQQRYRIQQIPNAVQGDNQVQLIPNAQPGDAQYQLIDNQPRQIQQNQQRRVIAQNQNNPDDPQYNNQKSQLDNSATDV